MGLASIPTRTSGSLGPTKVDVAPPSDHVGSIRAAEYNLLADKLIEVCEAVGLEDGATPESIAQAVRRHLSSPSRFAFHDDFVALENGADQKWNTTALTSGGTIVGVVNHSISEGIAPSGGWGILHFSTAGAAHTAGIQARVNLCQVDKHAPIEMVARVATPNVLANTGILVGLRSSGSRIYVQQTAGGTWEVVAESAAGGSSESLEISNVTPAAGAWHEVRLVVRDGAFDLYIDGVRAEFGFAFAPESLPQGTDALTPFFQLDGYTSTLTYASIDWISLSGVRP